MQFGLSASPLNYEDDPRQSCVSDAEAHSCWARRISASGAQAHMRAFARDLGPLD
jgi:hypothetical protein